MKLARLLVCFALTLASQAGASEVVVAQVSPMTGPLALNGKANYIGAKALFDQINADGGIHGAKIRFVVEDDQYAPDATVALVQAVAKRDRPVVFVNLFGSANVAALLADRTLERVKVPAIGVTPGAESLREPGSTMIFHVQAGDRQQLEKVVTHIATVGIRTAAVVFQDNPFGKSGVQYVDRYAKAAGLKILGSVPVAIGAEDLLPAAHQLRALKAAAYVMVLAPNSGASLIRDLRSIGDRTPVYGMSYIPVDSVVAKAGIEAAKGVALAQITPNSYSESTRLTRDFKRAFREFGPKDVEPGQLHLMGYIAARVAVDALRRAGPSPTPQSVAAAMHDVRMDLGGFLVDLTSGNIGANYVNIGVIDQRGHLTY